MGHIDFAKELKGERIVLKEHPITFEHAEEAFEIIKRCEKTIGEFFDFPRQTHSPEDYFTRFLLESKKKHDENKVMEYMITLNEKFIGQISLLNINFKKGSGKIGYWLDDNYVGNGYVQESVRILEKYIFDSGFYSIQLNCAEHNVRSKNTIEKLGYTYEGSSRSMSIINGKRYDTLNYSKLKGEYYQENN